MVARRSTRTFVRWHERSRRLSFGYRVFVVQGDDVTPLAQKTFDALYLRGDAMLPRFAGRTIQVALVFYTLKDRRPERVFRIDCERIRILEDGSIDKDHQFKGLHLIASRLGTPADEDKSEGSVVDAKARFDQKNWEHRHPKLSGPAHKQILTKLFRHAI